MIKYKTKADEKFLIDYLSEAKYLRPLEFKLVKNKISLEDIVDFYKRNLIIKFESDLYGSEIFFNTQFFVKINTLTVYLNFSDKDFFNYEECQGKTKDYPY